MSEAMAENTRLPWHASQKSVYISDSNNRTIAEMFRGGSERIANAALIVEAVNNYEALTAARRTFLGYLQAENCCKRTGAACSEKCACELELQDLVRAASSTLSSQLSRTGD